MTKRIHRNSTGAVQIAVARLADQPASLTSGKGNFSPAVGLHDRTVGGDKFEVAVQSRLVVLLLLLQPLFRAKSRVGLRRTGHTTSRSIPESRNLSCPRRPLIFIPEREGNVAREK